jgi:hypothetical protein
MDRVAERLVGRSGRHDLARERSGELVGDERRGRLPVCPVAEAAAAKLVVGAKPPWNQPQETPAAFNLSPMLVPLSATASRVEQSSQYGCASLVSE